MRILKIFFFSKDHHIIFIHENFKGILGPITHDNYVSACSLI